MPTPHDEAIRETLLAAQGKMAALNWMASDFSLEKAHVCALFSKLTYLHLPEYELTANSRFKLVPCEAYQRLALAKNTSDVGVSIGNLDIGPSFIIARRFLVIVGIRTSKALFIAIRGTAFLYDWMINLNARHYKGSQSNGDVSFHRGFYREAMSALPALRENLIKIAGDGVPIYVTGHSLGGAVAGVLHSLWNQRVPSAGYRRLETDPEFQISIPGSYTFGMPRYADLNAVITLRTPFHIYNEQDIVPTVPPSWLGFSSCPTEFMATGASLEQTPARETITFSSWIARLATGVGVRHHSMELYIERIAQNLPPTGGT